MANPSSQTLNSGPHRLAEDVAINFTIKWAVTDFKAFFANRGSSPDIEITPEGVIYNGTLLKNNHICTRDSYDSAGEFLERRLASENFRGMMKAADVLEFEVHGPPQELQKLREPLETILNSKKGAAASVVYWSKVEGAFFVPDKLASGSVKEAARSTVSVNVYWDIQDCLEFIKGVYDFQELTKTETEIRYYGFAMTGETAVCKEGYDSAQGFLTHLENVKGPLEAALRSAAISHIEVHGPQTELDKLRGPLKDFKVNYFSPLPARKPFR